MIRRGLGKACAVLLGCCLLASGCTGSAEPGGTLTVLAASSLTESFGALEKRFEADHPGVDVRISYDGSATLAQQVNNGVPADVFAAADERNMAKVVRADSVAGRPKVFATNRLSIVVGRGNPKRIRGLPDLGRGDLTVVVCSPEVPCGGTTGRVTRAAGVRLHPASEEQNVKSVLNKVKTGEADAGLVYVTDVRAGGDAVTGLDVRESTSAVNRYPIAELADAPEPRLAKQFIALVSGSAGRRELTKAGFGAP
ncbi:MAG: molybdate ABC transporter substrate-binding protein [Pseudonocardiaceae bacterium]|nr:molybdate ABC transporter substrate-binding protein [Pseudonocardiaceae bacterium]